MRLSRLKAFSAYARPEDHLVKRTYHGAVVTLLGVTLATVLFVHELQQFLAPQRTHEMAVDSSRGGMLDIHINVTFPSLPCQELEGAWVAAVLSLDVKDAAGNLDSSGPLHSQHHTGMKVEVHKWRVDPDGRPVAKGEYVQPAAQMINTLHGVVVQDSAKHMQDMEAAIANSEGCIVAGELEVKRLAGAFFISVHAADFLMMQAAQLEVASAVKQALKAKSSGGPESHVLHVSHDMSKINISHIINKVAFGPEFPRQVNPLDGYHRIVAHDSGAYQYFLKIVPTTYHASSILGGLGRARTSHQYSVNEYFTPVVQADASHIPAVTFHYDLFPISMKVQDRTSSLPHFLVRICAVVGGCFALSGLLDQTIHRIASVFAPQAATPTRRSISGENGPAAASLYSGASGLPSRTSSAISASSSAADGGPLFPDGPHPQPRISRSSSGLPSY